jgi:hypothetical protein
MISFLMKMAEIIRIKRFIFGLSEERMFITLTKG